MKLFGYSSPKLALIELEFQTVKNSVSLPAWNRVEDYCSDALGIVEHRYIHSGNSRSGRMTGIICWRLDTGDDSRQ